MISHSPFAAAETAAVFFAGSSIRSGGWLRYKSAALCCGWLDSSLQYFWHHSWGLFREASLRLSAACWRSRQVREKCLRSNQCEKAMAGLHNAEEMLESINADECEAPDVLSWREWQTWRAREGRRPAVRRGDTTPDLLAACSKHDSRASSVAEACFWSF